MKHKALLIFVIAWVIIFAMLLYIFSPKSLVAVFQHKNTTSHLIPTPTITSMHSKISPFPTSNPNLPNSGTTSFYDLLFSGKNQKCTFQDTNNITVTVSMSAYNVLGNFAFGNNSKKTVHLLADGGVAYIWIDGSTNGIQVPESQADNINKIMQKDGVSGFDSKAKKAYLCMHWIPSNSATIFAAPGNITFTTFGK